VVVLGALLDWDLENWAMVLGGASFLISLAILVVV
jgi:hypothetical protein